MSEEVLVAEKIFEEEVIIEETKGQIKPKAGWANRRLSQKMNKQICFVCREKQKRKQNKFVCSFFGRIYSASICFGFYLTFSFALDDEF